MEQKIKESIAVFLTVATIAFIAGAENYYSEMQYEFYLPLTQQHQNPPHFVQTSKKKASVNDSLRLDQRYAKK